MRNVEKALDWGDAAAVIGAAGLFFYTAGGLPSPEWTMVECFKSAGAGLFSLGVMGPAILKIWNAIQDDMRENTAWHLR